MSITTNQEAVMSNSTIPAQHPAVVLRSTYRNLRSLVAVLLVAVAGLSAAVVAISVDDQTATSLTSTHPPTASLGDPFQTRTQPTRPAGKPDESAVAAAISAQPTSVSSPDESKIAAAISSHSDTGPAARERAYVQALHSMTPKQLEAAFGHK
jgi:hypothetical protein